MASRRIIGRAIVVASIVLALGLGVLVLHRLGRRPRTTDAVVTANSIQIAPEVVGRIATLDVKDDAVVHKGDVLFTIESERYELNLAQARAQVRSLEAQVGLTNRRISSETTAVEVARAQASAARARLEEATRTLTRLEPLRPPAFASCGRLHRARQGLPQRQLGSHRPQRREHDRHEDIACFETS